MNTGEIYTIETAQELANELHDAMEKNGVDPMSLSVYQDADGSNFSVLCGGVSVRRFRYTTATEYKLNLALTMLKACASIGVNGGPQMAGELKDCIEEIER